MISLFCRNCGNIYFPNRQTCPICNYSDAYMRDIEERTDYFDYEMNYKNENTYSFNEDELRYD